jgi:hypothetical protein
MKRPWDKTVLGTKQSLDKTFSANLRQNVPIFRDGISVPENKTLHNFFAQNVPDPQKTSTAMALLLLPWQPGPGVTAPASRPLRRGPGGAAPAADPAAQPRLARENDAALAPTVSASAIRLHKIFGSFFEQNLRTDLIV